MSCTITPSPDGKYIYVKATGDLTSELVLKYILEAHALGREQGIARYLVDLTQSKNIDSVLNNYNFAYRDMYNTPGIDRATRVAMLLDPTDTSHNFSEVVAHNAGLNVTFFRDRNQAEAHLLKD